MSINIDSNAIRGDYKTDIVNRTINEIHDVIKTVFGPYATDAFIMKNGYPYYTRDGKEVLTSLKFDNEISNVILNLMYQAVDRQARQAGDGTTSLIMLYTNLYNNYNERLKDLKFPLNDVRTQYNKIIGDIISELSKEVSKPTDEEFKSMIYTCTQDTKLTKLFYDNIKDYIDEDTFIIVNKSDLDNDIDVISHTKPLIPCEKLYSLIPLAANGNVDHSAIFYIDGTLDIANIETLVSLINTTIGDYSINYTFLCAGVTETTKKTLKKFSSFMSDVFNVGTINKETSNNITIFKIDSYRNYDKDMCDDLSAFFYNTTEKTGISNCMTFESTLAHTFYQDDNASETMTTLLSFESPTEHIDTLKNVVVNNCTIKYSVVDGLLIDRDHNEASRCRYDMLRDAIESEKSAVKAVQLKKRLKAMYGKFVEINVGSKLLKDSQRKFELILDAVISSAEGVKYGVLRGNSIYRAITAVERMMKPSGEDESVFKSELSTFLIDVIYHSLVDTMYDLIENKVSDNTISIANYIDTNRQFNLHDDISCYTVDNMKIENNVIEPFSIIKMLLENSTIAIEIAGTKLFTTANFMQNYID